MVQHVFEHGKESHKDAAIKALGAHLVHLSKQKFSSNVVERCLQHTGEKTRDQLIVLMIGKDSDV